MLFADIQTIIAETPSVLVYFYNNHCAPCKVLRPKVQHMIETNFPALKFILIDTEHFPSTSAEFGIFASPTLIVFFEGKEYIRESKNISISELQSKITRLYEMIS